MSFLLLFSSSSDNAEPSSDADMETSEDEDIPGMRESDEEGVLHCTTKPTLSLAGGFRWEMKGGGGGNKRSFGGDEKHDTSGSSSEEKEEEEMEVEVRRWKHKENAFPLNEADLEYWNGISVLQVPLWVTFIREGQPCFDSVQTDGYCWGSSPFANK